MRPASRHIASPKAVAMNFMFHGPSSARLEKAGHLVVMVAFAVHFSESGLKAEPVHLIGSRIAQSQAYLDH